MGVWSDTWRLGEPDYVASRVLSNPDFLQARNELSALLSAALRWGDAATFKVLLDMGASPVTTGSTEGKTSATVWMIFCVFFAALVVSDRAMKYMHRKCEVLGVGVDAKLLVAIRAWRQWQ